MLCDKNGSIALRLKYFDAMVTSVVCFAAGHRTVCVGERRKFDVQRRKLLGRMVGPPADVNWNGPWHAIMHEWNVRIEQELVCNVFNLWSHRYLAEYWKFANYVVFFGTHHCNLLSGGSILVGYLQLRPPTYGSATSTLSLLC